MVTQVEIDLYYCQWLTSNRNQAKASSITTSTSGSQWNCSQLLNVQRPLTNTQSLNYSKYSQTLAVYQWHCVSQSGRCVPRISVTNDRDKEIAIVIFIHDHQSRDKH